MSIEFDISIDYGLSTLDSLNNDKGYKDMMNKNDYGVILCLALAVLFCMALSAHAETTGKLYVVGMGPAGPDLTAPRALSIVEKADHLLCSPGMPKRFERFGVHIDPSKVAFNPWENLSDDESKKKNPQSREKSREQQRKKVQDFVMEKINEGKTVAIMNGGDACIYDPPSIIFWWGWMTGIMR